MLLTEGTPEPSLAFELFETRTGRPLTSGWSLDALTTPARGGLGVARNLYKRGALDLDLGVYATHDYTAAFRGRFSPALGLGLHVGF